MKIFFYPGFTNFIPLNGVQRHSQAPPCTPAHTVTPENLNYYFEDVDSHLELPTVENLRPSNEVVEIAVKQLLGLENSRFFSIGLHKNIQLSKEQFLKLQENWLKALKEKLVGTESPLLVRNNELISPEIVIQGVTSGLNSARNLNENRARDLHWELGPLSDNDTRPVDRPIIIIAILSSGIKGGVTRIADVAGCLVEEFDYPENELRSLPPEDVYGIQFKPFWYSHIGKKLGVRINDKDILNDDIMDAVESRHCWTLNTESDEDYPMRLVIINNSFKLGGPMHGVTKVEIKPEEKNSSSYRYIRRGDLVIS